MRFGDTLLLTKVKDLPEEVFRYLHGCASRVISECLLTRIKL